MKSAPMISITGNNIATVLNPGRSEDAFVLWGTHSARREIVTIRYRVKIV